jgi:hypothetical protein
MYGDYSRGHEPDRKRGRNYRRVLLQMGRPVLDSDVASLVDALLGEVRATTRGLSCAAASPDLGFLVTPGRLLAIFAEAVDELAVTDGTPEAWLDYRFRLLDRYPALYLAASGDSGSVTLPLVQQLDPTGPARAALWARVEAPTTIDVNGISVNLVPDSPDVPQRVEFALGAATLDPLEVTVPDGAEVWLFLLEQDEAAGPEPAFWVAPGTYHLDGLVVEGAPGGSFPSVAFPAGAGFPWDESPAGDAPLDGLLAPDGLPSGTRLVAYLEAWERHVTAVEDPGIREHALGTSDTAARAELMGQVKLATLTGALPPGAAAAGVIRAAFEAVEISGGQLTIDVPETTSTTDPCALPELAGYSGSDNRLYRVEVHEGGGLSQVCLKWSRDNGSELFAARLDIEGNLVFDSGTLLAAGDIVEVLSSVVDLGDDALATVSAGGFVPAQRAVGQLAQLAAVEGGASADEVLFRLVDPDDNLVTVALDDRYGVVDDAVLKLRRWHGILDPQQIAGSGSASPGPHVLEEGIGVVLSSTGSYRPGQWWQYEARTGDDNANGPWRATPHGPERRFAPLALLEYQGGAQPLRLLAWLDERFSHPCDLDADDVAFAGARVGSESDSVQEAIEELFERPPEIVDASCGELVVRPVNGLQTVFDTIADGENRRVCFQPGTWMVAETIEIEGKGDLIITGNGAATVLEADGIDTVLRFVNCGRVQLRDLTIVGGQERAVGEGLAGSVAIVNCDGADLERVRVTCGAGASRRVSAVEVRSESPSANAPVVRIHDCQVEVGNAQVGLLVLNPASVDIVGNVVTAPANPWSLAAALSDPVVEGTVGRLLLDDFFVGETDEANDELLVGSNDVVVGASPAPDGRARIIVHLSEWANEFITFTTSLSLGTAQWRPLFEQNAIPDNSPVPEVYRSLRDLRHRLVAFMFGDGGDVNVPPAASATLLALATNLQAQNAVTAGGQGIVVAGRGTLIDPAFPEPRVQPGDPRPDARVTGNRILGFVQGIHLGTSGGDERRRLSYRVNVTDNLVHLRIPSLAGERHGIFVGSVFNLRVHGNTIELRAPAPAQWPAAGLLDGVRVWGTFGPLIQVHENSCIGTRNGVVARALNRTRATSPGWRWSVSANAHVGPAGGVPESINW